MRLPFAIFHGKQDVIFSDWFLPSKDELNEMYVNLHQEGLGDFIIVTGAYLSSSEYSDTYTWGQMFNNGYQGDVNKATACLVRCARTFVGIDGDYSLRDEGPASGTATVDKTYIFHIENLGGTDRRFYECAPRKSEALLVWQSPRVLIGTTSTDIGAGQSNTTAIVDWLNTNGQTDRAALYADSLAVYKKQTTTFFNDWFLPSKDELNEMYSILYNDIVPLGGFDDNYWTSSEDNNLRAFNQMFSTGGQYSNSKVNAFLVRCARTFVGIDGDYSLRDEGPASGTATVDKTYIFHIENLGGTDRRFYECAPKTSEIILWWSNPYSEIGASAQGTAIGTGASNTAAIVAWLITNGQTSHRAALYANNLVI